MSLSRGFSLFRHARNTIKSNSLVKQQVRHSSEGWVYRSSGAHHNKKWLPIAHTYMTIAWWWWLYHVYHEYEWVIGEWDVPVPSKWTDEELGIPPDDE